MSLSPFEFLSATFGFTLIFVYIIIGITICLKYFKTKQRIFIYMGLTWILLCQIWWPSVINVILLILNPSSGGLPVFWNYAAAAIFIPIAEFFFIIAITRFAFKKYRIHLLVFLTIVAIFFEIIIFYILFSDPGFFDPQEEVGQRYTFIIAFFIIIFMILFELMGLFFARDSIRSEDNVVKLKGKLILIAFILFAIGAFTDALGTIFILEYLNRLVLVGSVILFYFGFIMPDWIKERILRNEKI